MGQYFLYIQSFFCLFVIFFLITLCRQYPRPPQVGQDYLDKQSYSNVSVYYMRGFYYVIYTSPYLHSFFSISIKFFLCHPLFPMKHEFIGVKVRYFSELLSYFTQYYSILVLVDV